MAVKLYMPTAFDYFKREGDLIGRLVVEYGELEWTLCLLVSHVAQDLDLAVKTLYRTRGENQRINLADALIRNRIDPKVKQIYEETIARMRTCLKLRNQYAHSNWLRSGNDRLCYIDIEGLAERNDVVSMDDMTLYQLDMDIIEDQARFFTEVAQNLNYLCMEVQYLNGSTTLTGFHYVQNISPPRMSVKLSGLA